MSPKLKYTPVKNLRKKPVAAAPDFGASKASAGGPVKVAVLGGGNWGTTVAHLAATAGSDTLLWLRDAKSAAEVNAKHTNSKYTKDYPLHPKLRATTDLPEALRHARLIIAVIPSGAFRDVLRDLGPLIHGDQIFLHATKGLELGSGKTISQIVKEETAIRKLGVLSGPNIANEILMGLPSATVVASRYPEVVETAQQALVSEKFRVYANRDVIGVELAGALKNIVAIGSGIVTGLKLGENTRALLMTRGLAEMVRYAGTYGARPMTFAGLAGMGDLVVTCSSQHSRNYRVGLGLSEGKKLEDVLASLGMVAEGVKTVRVVRQIAAEKHLYMPITEGLWKVIEEGLDVREGMKMLMTLPSRAEVDGDFAEEV